MADPTPGATPGSSDDGKFEPFGETPMRVVNGNDPFEGLTDEVEGDVTDDVTDGDIDADAFRSIFVNATYLTNSFGTRQLRELSVNIPVFGCDDISEYIAIMASSVAVLLERKGPFTVNGNEVHLP